VGDAWQFRPDQNEANQSILSKILLNINEGKNGTWSGTYTDSTGHGYNLVLRPIIADSITSPFSQMMAVSEMNLYEKTRLANIDFRKIKTDKQGKDLLVEWFSEQQSGIEFFRLQSTNKKLNTDSVNATLTTAHLSMVENFYQHRSAGIPPALASNITYLSKEVVGYETTASAPDPVSGNMIVQKQFSTTDIHSGQMVNLEDLLWFGEQDNIPEPVDLFKIYKYRNSTFAPKIFALLKQLYPAKIQSDSCGINKPVNWALPIWSLTPQGIAFDFKAANSCSISEWAILPYHLLKPYLQSRYHF
jgi:hypothetical protein